MASSVVPGLAPRPSPARDPERPSYHLAPPHGGWLNDPNGPMIDKDGRIHLVSWCFFFCFFPTPAAA